MTAQPPYGPRTDGRPDPYGAPGGWQQGPEQALGFPPAGAGQSPAPGGPSGLVERPGERPGGPPRPSPGRRLAAVAGVVAVAVAGAGGGWLLAHGGDGSSAARSTAAASTPAATASGGAPTAAASASPSPSASVPLSGVTATDAKAALAELKGAGLKATGAPVEAWSWTDTNGRNLLLTTKTVEKREGDVVRAATLHVYHAAGLGTQPRMLLTPLRDPGTPNCDVDFGLDFVPGSIKVTDTDGDGYGEATVGWWSVCRGDPGPERLKLALLTKDTYYILRGYGLRASEPPLPSGITVKPATFQPNVPESQWPAGSYAATVALFRQLFR